VARDPRPAAYRDVADASEILLWSDHNRTGKGLNCCATCTLHVSISRAPAIIFTVTQIPTAELQCSCVDAHEFRVRPHWLLPLLVRHAARALHGAAAAPLAPQGARAALEESAFTIPGHEPPSAVVTGGGGGPADSPPLLGALGVNIPSGWRHAGRVLDLLSALLLYEPPSRRAPTAKALVDAGGARLLVSLLCAPDAPLGVFEGGCGLAVQLLATGGGGGGAGGGGGGDGAGWSVLSLGVADGPAAAARRELLASLELPTAAGAPAVANATPRAAALHGLCDRLKKVGRLIGLGTSATAATAAATDDASDDADVPAALAAAAARRSALLLLRLIEGLSMGPMPRCKSALRGAPMPQSAESNDDDASGGSGAPPQPGGISAGATAAAASTRPDVLSELCRWLLCHEARPKVTGIPTRVPDIRALLRVERPMAITHQVIITPHAPPRLDHGSRIDQQGSPLVSTYKHLDASHLVASHDHIHETVKRRLRASTLVGQPGAKVLVKRT